MTKLFPVWRPPSWIYSWKQLPATSHVAHLSRTLKNLDIAVGISSIAALEPEICWGGNCTPRLPLTSCKKGYPGRDTYLFNKKLTKRNFKYTCRGKCRTFNMNDNVCKAHDKILFTIKVVKQQNNNKSVWQIKSFNFFIFSTIIMVNKNFHSWNVITSASESIPYNKIYRGCFQQNCTIWQTIDKFARQLGIS